jgi:hypothetical protein
MNVIVWLGTVFASLFQQHQPAIIAAGFFSWLAVASKNGSLTVFLAKVPGRAHDVLIVLVPSALAGWQAYGAGSPIGVAVAAGVLAGGIAILAERIASRGFPLASVAATLEAVEAKGLGAKDFAKELVSELAANPDVTEFIQKLFSQPKTTVVFTSPPTDAPPVPSVAPSDPNAKTVT